MKKKNALRTIVLTGMMTAVLAVLSIIVIPMPTGVPVTLQTFAVAICGYILGWKMGAVSAFLYMLLGAIGVPIFAGMTGGFGILIGPTGGFIFGFIFMTGLCGLGVKKGFPGKSFVFGALGLIVCHLLGVAQFALVTGTGLWKAFLLASAPYLIKDAVSVAVAAVVAIGVRRALSAASLMHYAS